MQNKVKPNVPYLKSLIDVKSDEELLKKLKNKFQAAIKKRLILKDDLLPFFSDANFVDNFINNLDNLLFSLIAYLK